MKINKNLINWFIWFFLVTAWNFGYPEASPSEDVAIAVLLSIIFIIIKKLRISE
tara:strand:- start:205 stop:366 length:162 start_codon:yes stop_codon:yes gene_type:complete